MINCPDCQGMGFLRTEANPNNGKFSNSLVCCPNPIHQPEYLARLAQLSNLSRDELNRRLSDIKPRNGNEIMLIKAKDFIANPFGWLYVWGSPGNAKTEVLIAIVNELNQANRGPAMYIKFSQIVEFMRDVYAEQKNNEKNGVFGNTYLSRFDALKSIRVIAIDEMDKIRETDFSNEFRFDFLDERYRQGILRQTATVFAGNSDPAEFPGPIYDRIRDGRFSIVHNTAGSARPNMKG